MVQLRPALHTRMGSSIHIQKAGRRCCFWLANAAVGFVKLRCLSC